MREGTKERRRSLYEEALATYGRGDQFDQSAAVGFIQLWGLPLRTQARLQLGGGSSDELLRLTAGTDAGAAE